MGKTAFAPDENHLFFLDNTTPPVCDSSLISWDSLNYRLLYTASTILNLNRPQTPPNAPAAHTYREDVHQANHHSGLQELQGTDGHLTILPQDKCNRWSQWIGQE